MNVTPTYVPHEGTLRIANKTDPNSVAKHARRLLEQGISSIDFVGVGVNATHQSVKAQAALRSLLLSSKDPRLFEVAFIPRWFMAQDNGTEITLIVHTLYLVDSE